MTRSNTVEAAEAIRDSLDVADVMRITGWGKTKVFELIKHTDPEIRLPSFQLGFGRTCKRYVRRGDLDAYLKKLIARNEFESRPPRGRIPRASSQRQARQRRPAA